MNKINKNFKKLPGSYLFAEINRQVTKYQSEHPDAKIIRMGIGDITRPLPPSVIKNMHKAVDELTSMETLHGYGPEQGYAFLRDAIVANDYAPYGADIAPDEIFVSDGAKSDTANIVDLFSNDVRVAVTDPVYPVYVDSNALAGRAGEYLTEGYWSGLQYLTCNAENGFVPALPTHPVDIIYLCYPNNPTGTTLTRDELKRFVDYALSHDTLLLFDAAYEAFIREDNVPHSIYEIEGAKKCAIEFRSYSKTAGFTGVRCGYTVVPKTLPENLNAMWSRRQTTKFNGASYISQCGAMAIYSEEGKAEVKATIDYYLDNARTIRNALDSIGVTYYGGVSSPYIWLKTPKEYPSSWDYFHYLLTEKAIVGTPGVGFGLAGEGYLRLSAFNSHEATHEAMDRLTM